MCHRAVKKQAVLHSYPLKFMASRNKVVIYTLHTPDVVTQKREDRDVESYGVKIGEKKETEEKSNPFHSSHDLVHVRQSSTLSLNTQQIIPRDSCPRSILSERFNN